MAEVDAADGFVGSEVFGGAVLEDAAFEEEVGAVGDVQGFLDVVVGDEDADAAGAQLFHDVLDVLDGDGVDAGERLVEEDEGGVGREGAGDLGAALFTAAENVAPGLAHLLELEFVEEGFEPVALFGAAQGLQFEDALFSCSNTAGAII